MQVMSNNTKYFLFEDRLKKEWRVYNMSDIGEDVGGIRSHKNVSEIHKHDYVMKNVYTLPFHKSDLIPGTSKDEGWHEKAITLMK